MTMTNFKKKGFTLVEMIIVISIIAILSLAILVNQKSGSQQLALQRGAYRLAQDIRMVQAMAGLEESGCLEEIDYKYGYGVYFDKGNSGEYILFADCNGNKIYDSGVDFNKEIIKFEKEVEISDLKLEGISKNKLHISFEPPEPSVHIENGVGTSGNLGEIIISFGGKTKIVSVNKVGLIDVD